MAGKLTRLGLSGRCSHTCHSYGQGVGLFSVGKAIMEEKGIPVGPPRLPLVPFPDDKREQLRQDLEALKLL